MLLAFRSGLPGLKCWQVPCAMGPRSFAFAWALLLITVAPPLAGAQQVQLSAGSAHTEPVLSEEWAHEVGGRVLFGTEVSELFDVFGGVGLGAGASLEVGARLRPWRGNVLEPYLQAGYGRYEFVGDHISALPLGAGLHYQMSGQAGLFAELEHRWTALQHDPDAGISTPPPVQSAWMPRAGLSFKFRGRKAGPHEENMPNQRRPDPIAVNEAASAQQAVPRPERPRGVSAQLSVGSVHTEPVLSDEWKHDLGGRLSFGLPVSPLFDFYGGVGFGEATALEVGARLRPWRGRWLEPYLQAGYGRYQFVGDHTSVLPMGAGLHYQVNDEAGLFFELAHRWAALQHSPDAGIPTPPPVQSAWTPRVGVSVGFGGSGRPDRPESEPTPGLEFNGPSGIRPRSPGGESRPEWTPPPAARKVQYEVPDSAIAGRFGALLFDPYRYEEMTLLPDGIFIMGLMSEDPLALQTAGRKHVTVNAFYIDQFEVTNADYRAYLAELSSEEREAALPDSTLWAEARSPETWGVYFRGRLFQEYPVVGVNWDQAEAYCQAQGGRLPTEAEWEYAARAGHMGDIYPWEGFSTRDENGDFLANYQPREGYPADGYAFTSPVGAFPPNDWGLYQMVGNVAEWTRDAYTPSYEDISDFNPYYQNEEEKRRVVRGGSWASTAYFIGVGVRSTQPREEASINIGFRCVREVSSGDSEPRGTPAQAPAPDNGQPER